ncbi:Choline-sulfatase [Stieleria maiorica]|uniref:Choline-sulfatase n=1 Tax=Stieleria maiorica TaxID=2795974 RepID=A0A5B9M9N2_9BACT|nr:sulfatase [Stieleria maiorica]QEF97393.1 Choline-sulfatase [Stieleria maiorica]
MKLLPLLGLLAMFFAGSTHAAAPPNVLVILADDCTYNDLPMYGGENAKTPNLDRLASQGLTFNRAFLSEAMCQPCRAELYSGLYPMRNGCAWNHSASHSDIESMPQYLGAAGYRVGLAGKVHVLPRQAFPFESVGGFDKNCVRDPTQQHQIAPAAEFMSRSDDPFCLVVALVEPHVPWVMGDASAYPPKSIKLPPNIADTPETRRAFGAYLAEITYMDSQVGQLLDTLDATGKADNTLVLFSSEQGSQYPGNKWTNYNTGVHTALIARMPGIIQPGKRTDALVQYADVLPTLMDLAGIEHEAELFDGTSFADVLRGQTDQHRQYVYGVHNNVPEGPPYPIRSISDGRYHYIRNLQNQNLYIEKHLMGIKGNGKLNNIYWQTWVFESFDNEKALRLIQRYQLRPSEELFDLENDPYEMNNLAGSSGVAAIQTKLSGQLDAWLDQQADPGIEQDTVETHRAAKQGNHRFRPKR